MQSIIWALTKDYSKRGWPVMLIAVSVVVLGPLSFMELLKLDGLTMGTGTIGPFTLYFNYAGLTYFAFALSSVLPHVGVATRARTLPISSRFFVTWLFVSTGLGVVAQSLVTSWLYVTLLGVDWPVLGPTLFFLVAVWICLALFWDLQGVALHRLALWGTLVVGTIWWFLARFFPEGFSTEIKAWSVVTFSEACVLAGAGAAAFAVAVPAFSRYRCGAAQHSRAVERLVEWVTSLVTRSRLRHAGPLSAVETLRYLNWREFARLAATSTGAVFLLIMLWIMSGAVRGEVSSPTVVPLVFALFAGQMLGGILGLSGLGQHKPGLNTYIAVLPVTDRQLANVFMRNAAKACGLVWVCMILGSATPFIVQGLWTGENPFLDHLQQSSTALQAGEVWGSILLLTIPLLALWTSTTLLASLCWTGQQRFVTATLVAVWGLLVFGTLLVRFILPEAYVSQVMRAALWFSTVLVCGGTVLAFGFAHRRHLIGFKQISGATVCWCLLAAASWWLVPAPAETRACVSAMLVLPVTPLATAPLSLSWNRHR